MPQRFIQKIAKETIQEVQTDERPCLLITSLGNEVIINGVPTMLAPHNCYYIPTHSYCYGTVRMETVIITLTLVQTQPLLCITDNFFRYSHSKKIYQSNAGELTYDLLAAAIHGTAAGTEHLYDILRTLADQIHANTLVEGNMTIIQRLSFAAEMEQVVADFPKSTAASLAGHFNITEHTLWRRCKAVFGLSTRDFLSSWRYQQAIHLLTVTDKTIEEITEHVGYTHPEYLRNLVKKNTGHSALRWRKKMQKIM